MDLVFYIWKSVMIGYTSPKTPPTGVTEKKPSENNAKSMNSTLCGLPEYKFFKVMHCGSEKKFGIVFKIYMSRWKG
jgi:hypothetical protein